MDVGEVKELLVKAIVNVFEESGSPVKETSEKMRGMVQHAIALDSVALKNPQEAATVVKKSFMGTLPRSIEINERGIIFMVSIEKIGSMEDMYQVSVFWKLM